MSTGGGSTGGSGPPGSGGSGKSTFDKIKDKSPINRRQFVIGSAATFGAGAVGTGGLALNEELRGQRFLPNVDKDSFERATNNLVTRRDNAISSAEDASDQFESIGGSLEASDYRGEGLQVTEDIRLAVPADAQSDGFEINQGGDSREFTWLDDTEPVGGSLEDMVHELDEEVGLSESDRSDLANNDLLDAAIDLVPYVGRRVLEDGSQGQPQIGDQQLDEFDEFIDDLAEAESAYEQALDEVGESSRELSQQAHYIMDEEREKVRGLLPSWVPLADKSEYSPDEHFDGAEAQQYAEHIIGEAETTQDEYGERVRELAMIKSIKHAGDQVLQELDQAQEDYAEGEFDETGEPVDDSGYEGDDPMGNWYEDEVGVSREKYAQDQGFDNPEDLSLREDSDGDYSVFYQGDDTGTDLNV